MQATVNTILEKKRAMMMLDVGLSPCHPKLEEVSQNEDRTSYYSRRDQEDLSQYNENPVPVPRYEESFSNDQIEYADIDLSDDYDDYGMEIEFEHQLNKIEDGAGLHYVGESLISRIFPMRESLEVRLWILFMIWILQIINQFLLH